MLKVCRERGILSQFTPAMEARTAKTDGACAICFDQHRFRTLPSLGCASRFRALRSQGHSHRHRTKDRESQNRVSDPRCPKFVTRTPVAALPCLDAASMVTMRKAAIHRGPK